jgi:hypothetical protein
MRVTVDARELAKEQDRAALNRPDVRAGAWKIVRAQAFQLERNLKPRIPKATGRARNSWGHSTPPASAADGVWIEDESGLSVIEGSNVEYMGALNEGHSMQAPAGFIDAEAALIAELLDRALTEFVKDVL